MFENGENIVFGEKTQFLKTCSENGSERKKENVFSLKELNDEEGLIVWDFVGCKGITKNPRRISFFEKYFVFACTIIWESTCSFEQFTTKLIQREIML